MCRKRSTLNRVKREQISYSEHKLQIYNTKIIPNNLQQSYSFSLKKVTNINFKTC